MIYFTITGVFSLMMGVLFGVTFVELVNCFVSFEAYFRKEICKYSDKSEVDYLVYLLENDIEMFKVRYVEFSHDKSWMPDISTTLKLMKLRGRLKVVVTDFNFAMRSVFFVIWTLALYAGVVIFQIGIIVYLIPLFVAFGIFFVLFIGE